MAGGLSVAVFNIFLSLRHTVRHGLHAQLLKEAENRTAALADDADRLRAEDQYDEQCRGNRDSHPQRSLRHKYCSGTEHDRDAVDDQNGLAVAEAELQQTVMQMAFVRGRDRHFVDVAAQDREERIRQRHSENEQRNQERHERSLFKAHDRENRQAKAKEQGAGVAHENFRRVEVIEQKADNASQQNGAEQHDRNPALTAHEQCKHENGRGSDAGNAGGQAVQAVDQVNGVRDADNPKYRKRNTDPCHQIPRIAERNVKKIDTEAIQNDNDCRNKLA